MRFPFQAAAAVVSVSALAMANLPTAAADTPAEQNFNGKESCITIDSEGNAVAPQPGECTQFGKGGQGNTDAQARNVIFILGDGMGHQEITAARNYLKGANGRFEGLDELTASGAYTTFAVGPDGKVDMSRIYVALIGRLDRRGRLLWSMPKGHVENGEHQWKTAEREVWEETGITGEAFDTLGTIDYWFVSDGVRIHKTVHHNLLRYVDGVFNDEDPEVTEVAWVPMSELMEHLAYADERKLARIACDRMPDLARKEAQAGRATPR